MSKAINVNIVIKQNGIDKLVTSKALMALLPRTYFFIFIQLNYQTANEKLVQ